MIIRVVSILNMRGYDRSRPLRQVGSCSEPTKLENGMPMVGVGTGVVDMIDLVWCNGHVLQDTQGRAIPYLSLWKETMRNQPKTSPVHKLRTPDNQ